MYEDFIAFQRYLKARIEIYRINIRKESTFDNIAQLLSVTLYQKIFSLITVLDFMLKK